MKVRADKALQSIRDGLSKLLAKHVVGLLGDGNGSTFKIEGAITSDGNASARLTYQTTVSDGIGFKLDDGQADLKFPTPGEPPTDAEKKTEVVE